MLLHEIRIQYLKEEANEKLKNALNTRNRNGFNEEQQRFCLHQTKFEDQRQDHRSGKKSLVMKNEIYYLNMPFLNYAEIGSVFLDTQVLT